MNAELAGECPCEVLSVSFNVKNDLLDVDMARAGFGLLEGFLHLQSTSELYSVVHPVLKPQTVVTAKTPSYLSLPPLSAIGRRARLGSSRDAGHSSQALAVW